VTMTYNSMTATGVMMVKIVSAPGGGDGGFGSLQSTSSSGTDSGTIAGAVVDGFVAVAVLIIVIALIIVRSRKNRLTRMIQNEPFYQQVGANTLDNPTYHQWMQSQQQGSAYSDFEPGVANPMYGWYRPDMSRQEVEEMLAMQQDGSFLIRDSTATPGWHMLAVKTHNAIVHEKIKMGEDGLYEVLSATGESQPRFNGIPALVEYYSKQQDGVRFALSLDNPLYDNNHMAQKRTGHAVAGAFAYQTDAAAPALPLKERERAVMQSIVDATGEEFYTNAQQAKTAMSTSA